MTNDSIRDKYILPTLSEIYISLHLFDLHE